MELTLVAIDDDLEAAWSEAFADLRQGGTVRVWRGDVLALDVDAVVSPANSFGFMDGGIDGVYARHFGPGLVDRVRARIDEIHGGELVVGTADIVATGDAAIPWLISAPTMRVPMRLVDSVNAYLAARAVFRLVTGGRFTGDGLAGVPVHERVDRVALPGLGTGVGGMAPPICARQVRRAYDDVVSGSGRVPATWEEAFARHEELLGPERPGSKVPGQG